MISKIHAMALLSFPLCSCIAFNPCYFSNSYCCGALLGFDSLTDAQTNKSIYEKLNMGAHISGNLKSKESTTGTAQLNGDCLFEVKFIMNCSVCKPSFLNIRRAILL
jgi:hypothetical protein